MIIQPFNSSKMKQLQILFDKAVEATMNASGLSFEEFTTSRSERSVNARVVFVDYLIEKGMSEGTIAELSGHEPAKGKCLEKFTHLPNENSYVQSIKKKSERYYRISYGVPSGAPFFVVN